jgi:branched-chain amino acid transport system ATP-binding protein
MARPRFLLLDEPSLGLAPRVVTHISQTIRQLPHLGVGVLLVEQNASVALDVADRGYLMAGGRVVLSASADRLRTTEDVKAIYLGRSVRPPGGVT